MDIQDQEKMTAMEIVKYILKEKRIKKKTFAAMIGKAPSNLSAQMQGNYLKAEDWKKWLKALGYKVVVVPIEEKE